MPAPQAERLRGIKTLPQLLKYLHEELDWPIDSDDAESITFEYDPSEFGLDEKNAVRIKEIKQLRPLSGNQPWGIFFVNFEKKRLPVMVMRRILRSLVFKKRNASAKSEQQAWHANDLLFVSAYGEESDRAITFAHFVEDEDRGGLAELRVLGWDDDDTPLKYDYVAHTLHEKLRWRTEFQREPNEWRKTWRDAFELRHREVITTSKQLASQLAELAKKIRARVRSVLRYEDGFGQIRKLQAAFRKALIHDLSDDDFADMYAQTITYGLFSAAVSRPAGIHGENIVDMVPVTNPFLRDMLQTFLRLSGRKGRIDFDELGIQEVVALLNSPSTHLDAVLRDFGNRTQREDPVIHFYEDFLREYDTQKKVQRGVFYTPQPVVSYIVRSVHELLQTEFGLEDGLADTTTWREMVKKHADVKIPEGVELEQPFVQILDPATGTATFLVEVIEVIHRHLNAKWDKGGLKVMPVLPTASFPRLASAFAEYWNQYVALALLPRLHGYELMMAPYAIAHMKIGLKLFETGYRFGSGERARIYLTNALEPSSDIQRDLPSLSPALAHEAEAVNEIKRHKRFTVVIGNPPYARISSNMGTWISELIEDFKYVDGVHFAEVKHWLHDDYVKFLRLGYLNFTNTGCGVFGMITNRGYLSGPTFRGMRSFIWQKSSTLHLLDLHGGALQEECKPPPGVDDENVFDIKQGVAIFISALTGKSASASSRTYTEFWGDRETKYDLLAKQSASSKKGTELAAVSPRYDFIPSSNVNLDREYSAFVAVNKVFPIGSTGIQTSRDAYVVDFEKARLQERFEEFCDSNLSDGFFRTNYGLDDGRNWSLSDARRKLRADREWNARIVRCQFRPLDIRWMLYHSSVINWPRPEVMPHMLQRNISLVVPRNYQGGRFDAALVSRFITEVKTGESTRGSYCYPLYLYGTDGLFRAKTNNPTPNIDEALLAGLAKNLKLSFISKGIGNLVSTFGPEDVLNYVYASLYSLGYRERYSNLIRNEFPRLPLTSNLDLFRALAGLGGELVVLHLLESPKLDKLRTEFIGGRNPEVEKISWSKNTVWIDKAQTAGFNGVPEAVWNFHIGGYQVCEKWLKDRKGRTLSKDDIAHYYKIVIALAETIRLMSEIDKVIEKHGGWPGAFATAVHTA